MKYKTRKLLAIPLIAVAICSGGFSVSAALPTEGIGDNETLNALYYGAPPIAPTAQPTTAPMATVQPTVAINATVQPTTTPSAAKNTESPKQSTAAGESINTISDLAKTSSPIPFDGITPQNPPGFSPSVDTEPTSAPTPTTPPLYPFDVRGVEDGGTRWILKSYALANGESPDGISREAFERDGWRYELTDIVRQSNVSMDTKMHEETVTLESATNDVTEILKLLAPTLDYSSADGYEGVLELDIASVTIAEAGTQTSSFTANATREYPHLSANDTALVPKTITENGRTLTLADVTWRAAQTDTIDYDTLSSSYTAIATYTRVGTRVSVTGYEITAAYKGTIARLLTERETYTAYFAGVALVPSIPDDAPGDVLDESDESEEIHDCAEEVADKKDSGFDATTILPAVLGITGGAGILGGAAYVLLFRRNVKVHNLTDGKYVMIGKTRLSARNPIANLTPFADKAVTGSFILVLDVLTARALAEKTVTVNYGDKSLQHIVAYSGLEYQIEVDF